MSTHTGYWHVTNSVVERAGVISAGGTANALTVTLLEPIAAYTTGLIVKFFVSSANTGAVTINVDGKGIKNLVANDNTALAAGALPAGGWVTAAYDGTSFRVQGSAGATGQSGYSGYSGVSTSGYSGFSGRSGYSGYSGATGASTSGYSGYSGSGVSGYSGYSGSGISGYSGYSGVASSGYSGYSGTSALTDPRVYTPTVNNATGPYTITVNCDSYDLVVIEGADGSVSIANPTGTPGQGRVVQFRTKDNGTSRALTYGTQIRAVGSALPTSTTAGKTIYYTSSWNSNASKWDTTWAAEV